MRYDLPAEKCRRNSGRNVGKRFTKGKQSRRGEKRTPGLNETEPGVAKVVDLGC